LTLRKYLFLLWGEILARMIPPSEKSFKSNALVLVLFHVQQTQFEEGEEDEVDFHPHYHHLKKTRIGETRIGALV
jgi:hypothetical protein